MEKIRQDVAKIELADPHPEQDCDGPEDETAPPCLQKLANGKFRSSSDRLNDFRETFSHKFLTKEEELNRYKHNDEKDDDYYKDKN